MQWGLREQCMVPQEFWRSTLRELFPQPQFPPDVVLRQRFDELMKEWPDD